MNVRILTCVILAFLLMANTVAAQPSLEYKVKAAFLLNFIRYTDWPENVFPATTSPTVICILGKDPFGEILDQTIKGKKVWGRNVVVQRILINGLSMGGCHVIFMSQPNKDELSEVNKLIKNVPALVVQDSNGPDHEKGMIHFVAVEKTVRFEINLKMAQKAGLKFSSRMIALSENIYD